MSINKAPLRDDRRLINTVKQQGRYIRELKTPQKVGADVVQVQPLPTSTVLHGGPLALTPGLTRTFIITVNPGNQVLTLWNYLFTVTIDVDDTTNNCFPAGPSLTDAQRNLRIYHWIDWANSNDTTNSRVIYVRLENYDVSSHNYYLWFRFYAPVNLGGSTS